MALGVLDTSLDSLTPDTRSAVKDLLSDLDKAGIQYKVRSTLRTCAEQAEQYSIGRGTDDTRAIVTQAKGCMSWHTLGRAVDITLIGAKTNAEYQVLGDMAKARGFKWGGDFPGFPDVGHVEYHPGVAIESVCQNPDDCEAGVAASRAMATAGAGGDMTPILVCLASAIVLGIGTHLVLSDPELRPSWI